jgi:hypothetical protein
MEAVDRIAWPVAGVVLTVACARQSPPAPVATAQPVEVAAVEAPRAMAAEPEPTPPPGESSAEPPEPMPAPALPCRDVTLTIKSERASGYVTFIGALKNGGSAPVTLILPGDGSTVGWRTPVLTWQASTPSGKPAKPRMVGRCGNVNALQASEVFTLQPGETKELRDWLGEPYVEPGRYVVRLTYENDPTRGLKGIPLGESRVPTAFRGSAPCRVVSQPLTVDL